MLIREYRPDDFPAVESLWKKTGIYTVERGDTPEIILRCREAGGKFLVLVDQATGQITGTSWMTWDGRRLALESLAFARELNCPLKLEVHKKNTPARAKPPGC